MSRLHEMKKAKEAETGRFLSSFFKPKQAPAATPKEDLPEGSKGVKSEKARQRKALIQRVRQSRRGDKTHA